MTLGPDQIWTGPRFRTNCASGGNRRQRVDVAYRLGDYSRTQQARARRTLKRVDQSERLAVLAHGRNHIAVQQLQASLPILGRNGPVEPERKDARTQDVEH